MRAAVGREFAQPLSIEEVSLGEIRRDIPQLIKWYREGKLELDGLVSRSYPLAEINQAMAAVGDGTVIRSVITMNDN